MGQREVTLACQMGTCTNQNWFYKLNPCFDADRGYIKYKLANETSFQKTNNLSLSGVKGKLTVDVDSGSTSKDPELNGSCFPSLILLSLLGFLMIRWE
jgi:hypothetical protein